MKEGRNTLFWNPPSAIASCCHRISICWPAEREPGSRSWSDRSPDSTFRSMLSLLNIVFFVGHTVLIGFNLTGWIWLRTRKLHRVTMGATLFSWLVMGAWKGWGYCLCTDWHFQLRRKLQIHGHESSFTELLLNQIPGVMVSHRFANLVTLFGLAAALAAMIIVWVREIRSAKSRATPAGGPLPDPADHSADADA